MFEAERRMAIDVRRRADTRSVMSIVRYDADRRRLWLAGQRCHHGATGALLAAFGLVLMAHDWKDRTIWFERGRQFQP